MANSKPFIFDYQNGTYGWNESEERGADTFHPFNSLSGTELPIRPQSVWNNQNKILGTISANTKFSIDGTVTGGAGGCYGALCIIGIPYLSEVSSFHVDYGRVPSITEGHGILVAIRNTTTPETVNNTIEDLQYPFDVYIYGIASTGYGTDVYATIRF